MISNSQELERILSLRGVGEEFECEFLELERILNLGGIGQEFEFEFPGVIKDYVSEGSWRRI